MYQKWDTFPKKVVPTRGSKSSLTFPPALVVYYSAMASREMIHRIRNYLSPIQTFLDIVEVPVEDEKLRTFQERCKDNLQKIKDLIGEMEREKIAVD